jgi:hypothetical protein
MGDCVALAMMGDCAAGLGNWVVGENWNGEAWRFWNEVMICCWGKEVFRVDSWRGLRGSDAVIDLRTVVDAMMNKLVTEQRKA